MRLNRSAKRENSVAHRSAPNPLSYREKNFLKKIATEPIKYSRTIQSQNGCKIAKKTVVKC